MTLEAFIDQAILLLEDIARTPPKRDWCKSYSAYDLTPGQNDLMQAIRHFTQQAYSFGIVITDYRQVMDRHGLDQELVAQAPEDWLSTLTYIDILACIAYHFRWDHFSEGNLISYSIAEGAMLRMFRQLKNKLPKREKEAQA